MIHVHDPVSEHERLLAENARDARQRQPDVFPAETAR